MRREEDEALDARALGGPQQPAVARPFSSSTARVGLVADRGGQMDDGVDAAQRLALEVAVAEPRQVAEGDLHVDAMAAQAARIANEGTHVVPGLEQQRQERPADGSTGPGQQDHGAPRALAHPARIASGLTVA